MNKHKLLTAVVAAVTLGAFATPAAWAADPITSNATPGQLMASTRLTVTAGADISGHTLTAVNLARYTSATISDNATAPDTTDDRIESVNLATANGLAGAVDTALKDSGVIDQANPAEGYDADDPMPWVARSLLDSQTAPYTGRLRQFLTRLTAQPDIITALDADTAATFTKPADGDGHTLTADVTPSGLYLIVDRSDTGAGLPMLVGTGVGTITGFGDGDTAQTLGTVEFKPNDITPVQKIVDAAGQETDTSTASIGDTVTYRIRTGIPNYDGYTTFRLTLTDTMPRGLAYRNVNRVTVDGKDLEDPLFKIGDPTQPDKDGNTSVTITFAPGADGVSDLAAHKDAFPQGKEIMVEYAATLTKDANVNTFTQGGLANTNTVAIDYSHDPADPAILQHTPGNTVDTYTGRFQLVKTDTAGKPLTGARFTVTRGKGSQPVNLTVVSTAANDTDASVYRPAIDGETPVTEVTTPASGKIIIQGLSAGDWQVNETHSPLGGATLPQFTVSLNPMLAGAAAGDPVHNGIEHFSGDINQLATSDNQETVTVRNAASILQLPKTGAAWMAVWALLAVGLLTAGVTVLRRRA